MNRNRGCLPAGGPDRESSGRWSPGHALTAGQPGRRRSTRRPLSRASNRRARAAPAGRNGQPVA